MEEGYYYSNSTVVFLIHDSNTHMHEPAASQYSNRLLIHDLLFDNSTILYTN